MMGGKGGVMEKIRRCVRTMFFMVAMVVSLLISSLPVLIAITDIVVPCLLVSSFTCLSCYSFRDHLRRYAFKSSLTDIPLVSIVRSLIITCVYSICDAPALSHGPYFGTVSLSSFVSILLLSVKMCVFSVHSQIMADETGSFTRRQKLHIKKSWGMPVLFLSSVVFALGHMVVAYRTSCRAKRKLMFHRVDHEAVLSCKTVFSGFQKLPRSPTPFVGKTLRCASEMRRKPFGTARDEDELPVRFLADLDSLFMPCKGLTLHYKLSMAGSTPRSVSTTFLKPNSSSSIPHLIVGRSNRTPLSVLSKKQASLQRSYSNQFHGSHLHTPLLENTTSSVLAEDIPVLSLEANDEEGMCKLNSGIIEKYLEGTGQFGIILIHGFGGGVFSWRHVMGELARQVGCTVAAFDRPGWGLTSRPLKKEWEDNDLPNPYKLDSQVDLLLSFCSEMGFTSVLLIGHDDGGLLALMAAQRVQSSANAINVSIKGVVLLNVSLTRDVVPGFARILMRTSFGKKHLVRPLLRTEISQVVNRRAWYDASKLTTEVLGLYKAPLCIEGWDVALHEIGKLSAETILSQHNASLLLKASEKLPILVIAGAEDVLVSCKSSQAMASKLVNSRLVAISGCGHLPHEECPQALLSAISPFITRLLSQPDLQNQFC